ncbi:hypothetical protein SAMN02910353_00826 [Ruminococcus sp. YRD2003]|uniref:hypothetical protein n=1 Tax=Ruminococcus sp. YRD2003 TaxID=1452313 RepID=UPI0008C174FF|nr:hypothetical protein SAMN02910353_00826 [Ruminococcus flavefaciens]
MKLNYRDKIILGALLAFVILLAGFFLLIKPKYTAIKDDKAALTKAEQERDDVDAKISEIKPLQERIKKTYDDTVTLTNDFVAYNDMYNARKVDQYMQHFAEDNEVKILNLNATDVGSGSVDYYYFTPTFVGDDLLKAADLNGDRQAANAELSAESDSLKDRTKENILSSNYTIAVTGTRENIWNYLKAIEDQDKTIIINNVSLNGIIISPEQYEKQADFLGVELSDEEKEMLEDDAEVSAQFTITLYSVYDLSEPNVEAD